MNGCQSPARSLGVGKHKQDGRRVVEPIDILPHQLHGSYVFQQPAQRCSSAQQESIHIKENADIECPVFCGV